MRVGEREGCKVVTTFYDCEHCEDRLLMTIMTNIALKLTTTSVHPNNLYYSDTLLHSDWTRSLN